MKRMLIFMIMLTISLIINLQALASPRISPEMELLGGVLSQTTWIQSRGPRWPGNIYFQALNQFFADYSDHYAIQLAQKFTDKGFTYDAPPAFICHLGPLPELELQYEYSDYLVNRAGGRDKLEEFRLALRDLAVEMDFLSFFQEWEPYLNAIVIESTKEFRREQIEQWLTDFFGWSASEFHLLMTASMFPGGGYGATVLDEAGNLIAYQIIRDYGQGEHPQFPSGIDLENLTIHELGHSFVNPSMELYPERANNLKALYWPVRKIMKQQAYTNVTTFLNEQVLRAVEVISARDLFTPEIEAEILQNQEKRGFYLTKYLVEQLEYYQANRDLYPTFLDFVPYIYEQLELYQAENSPWLHHLFGSLLR